MTLFLPHPQNDPTKKLHYDHDWITIMDHNLWLVILSQNHISYMI